MIGLPSDGRVPPCKVSSETLHGKVGCFCLGQL